MAEKRIIRRTVDIAMMTAIIILMTSQVTGQRVHEWTGIILFLLVIAHTVLNRMWYKSLWKGRYQPVRVLQTIINLGLLVCFVLTAVSGMLMSQYAVTFLRQEAAVNTARRLHLAFSHWSFVLVSAHLGIHWGRMAQPIAKHRVLWRVLSVVSTVAAGLGLCLFFRQQFPAYMFFRVEFAFLDYGQSPAAAFLQNILILVSWAMIFCELGGILKKQPAKGWKKRWISAGAIAAVLILAAVFQRILPMS